MTVFRGVLRLERNTKRLVDLVNQILDFRQVESKGFSLEFSPVNLTELIRENYVSFEALAVKRKISYNINLPAAPVQIQADAEALNKIFSNLFSNAVKYAERMVHIQLINPAKDDNVVRVEISNDGRNIPADMREKIFEPFVRLKESAKQKGTGIGLALARSLTELHGGKVYVSDEKNGMNVFVLEIPVGINFVKQKELAKTIEKPIIS